MDAAARCGIPIPSLCYLKDINEIAACRVCVVELEGKERLITSCNNVVAGGDGALYQQSQGPPPQETDRGASPVPARLSTAPPARGSGNCSLQKIANDLNILEIPFHHTLEHQPWNKNFPLIRENLKSASNACAVSRSVKRSRDWGSGTVEGTGSRVTINVSGRKTIEEADCSLCGQCITHCPVGALTARDDTEKVWEAIEDPEKIVVAQVAPAVRAAWGEELGLSPEEATIGRIMDALKRMGVDYAFDTVFSADLTIMEEASEFLERFTKGEFRDRPMFTSCCPGWVRFVKTQFPHMVKYLSTAKSPQQMFGAVMKTYYAQKLGVDPERIFTVSIMPCVAKKAEREMELFYEEYAGHDVDAVLTTRELVRMIRSAHIRPEGLNDIESDSPMREGTGAGVIFGATGGVMEAALRTAYFALKGKNAPADAFRAVRSLGFNANNGVQEAEFKIDDLVLRTAAVSGLGNTRALLERIDRGEVHYDFVEVMACPGGCVGGGGQPIHDGREMAFERGRQLYYLDAGARLRYSHENPDVKAMYEEFFEKPNSHKAHLLLHTEHRK